MILLKYTFRYMLAHDMSYINKMKLYKNIYIIFDFSLYNEIIIYNLVIVFQELIYSYFFVEERIVEKEFC